MAFPHPLFAGEGSPRATKRLGLLLLTLWTAGGLGGCVLRSEAAAPAPLAPAESPNAASDITTITLERDCFGCPSGSVLQLNRDGSATLTTTGKARSGTTPQTARGRLRAGEFEQLAQALAAHGFFRLLDAYEDPTQADGAWSTTSVARGALDKRVFSREGPMPAALAAMQALIDAVRAQTTWVVQPP